MCRPCPAPSARVVKLVDTRDLKSLDHRDHAGSIPAPGTKPFRGPGLWPGSSIPLPRRIYPRRPVSLESGIVMSFVDAMSRLLDGHRVYRAVWLEGLYVVMLDDSVQLTNNFESWEPYEPDEVDKYARDWMVA